MNQSAGPIVIVGGFASSPPLYGDLRDGLAAVSGRPVSIAPIGRLDWAQVVATDSYGGLLAKLDRAVDAALSASGAAQATLVAHSAGGVLARIFLGEAAYRGRAYAGHRRVGALITLGTPHRSERRGRVGGLNQIAWAEASAPGARWPTVRYTSVMGRSIFGDAQGPPPERGGFQSYALISGDGAQWGDGVVPLGHGLLPGGRQVIIPGLRHDPRPDRPWYGTSPAIIAAWWEGRW